MSAASVRFLKSKMSTVQLFGSYNLQMMFPIISILMISTMIQSSYCAISNESSCDGLFYNCGNLQGIAHPFWGGNRPESCGIRDFQLQCVEEQQTLILFDDIQKFRLLNIDQPAGSMTLARTDICDNACPQGYTNTSLPTDGFLKYKEQTVSNLTIYYGCSLDLTSLGWDSSSNQTQYNTTDNFHSCCYQQITNSIASRVCFADYYPHSQECGSLAVVPLLKEASDELWASKDLLSAAEALLQETINQGFDVEYRELVTACSGCEASGGNCGSNKDRQVNCYCQDQVHPTICPNSPNGNQSFGSPPSNHGNNDLLVKKPVVAGIVIAGIVLVVGMCIVIWCCKIKKGQHGRAILLPFKRISKDFQNLDELMEQHGPLALRRYNYSDIKKMTSSFKDKLGEGGFGEVYKGNLSNGRDIAVKILRESKKDGEAFFNEVLSISKTSHVNIVTLLGFCLDRQKRALVYEYMPKGSLDKYIHGETVTKTENHLGWETLHRIAVGIARGLDYLHKGCNTRILHFDIKPHNILLDEDCYPKISDFGLAQLCTKKGGIVSNIRARGTPGYTAPEFGSRDSGGASEKSDVYSYGMMLMEMVGGRRNIEVDVSRISRIDYPSWVYQRVVLDEDLELQGIKTKEEDEMARKMLLVGLWCIQKDPSKRPEMSKVIEMLEGSLQALEKPPKPFGGGISSPVLQ
ncbi:unnamed protein product [Coffea canephora]|uniref:non-specific serine/threonine protein kinase n=1 Tax=Coffea canephora TaxID=49390 RepID=A0A068TQ19_COFCA|nr:unnamed protein product [Coffea canephora]